ncbi:hypothetical protein ACFWBB_27420 [Streptomyces sp. NPDC060000]|uniref:hypothetical protein n=1 Tax=Streptomyces sp. NPDC060000 TaxID=3347031 RepID=UPI00368EB834
MGAREDGFTQLLVVESAEAAAGPELTRLRLRLSAEGMDVRETSEGGLEPVDQGAGNAVFEAPEPVMWASSTQEPAKRSAEPKRSTEPKEQLLNADGLLENAWPYVKERTRARTLVTLDSHGVRLPGINRR